jgi:hypothetical protein
MKKDDKQPDKPKKKPLKKAASKPSAKKQPTKPKAKDEKPIEIILPAKPKHILNLDAKKYRDSLSVDEWLELSEKDPNLLTPTQARQLAEANKQASEIAKRITEMYDFKGIAAMFKTIDTLPIARVMQQAQETALVLSKFQNNLILPTIPTQQLVTFQQNLAITTGVINQSFISAINAANITRNLFADMQRVSDIIIKGLSIDLTSLSKSLSRFTAIETIDLDVIEVIDRDGNIAIVSDTSQTKRIDDDYQYVSTAKFDLLLTEIRSSRQELAELKQLVKGQLPSGITKITYADIKFMIESSKLILKGHEIDVRRSSKQAKFCDFFFSSIDNFVKKWDVSHLMERVFIMHVGTDGNEDSFNNIIKGYVTELNKKIAIATKGQLIDFFILLNYEVYINPKYISHL